MICALFKREFCCIVLWSQEFAALLHDHFCVLDRRIKVIVNQDGQWLERQTTHFLGVHLHVRFRLWILKGWLGFVGAVIQFRKFEGLRPLKWISIEVFDRHRNWNTRSSAMALWFSCRLVITTSRTARTMTGFFLSSRIRLRRRSKDWCDLRIASMIWG